MRPPAIVISNIVIQDTVNVPLVDDQDVVEAFGTNRSDPAFGDRVCLGRTERRSDRRDAQRLQSPGEVSAVTVIAVVDQVTRRLAIPDTRLNNLTPGRVTGDMHVNQFTTGVVNVTCSLKIGPG